MNENNISIFSGKYPLMMIDHTEITTKGLELLMHYLKKRSFNVAKHHPRQEKCKKNI